MERNRGGRPRHPDVLTPAEWRVLEALREGGTNAEIAARLGVSPNTVRYHVSNMLAKLELRDRRALAAWRPDRERRGASGWLGLLLRPAIGIGAAAGIVAAIVVFAIIIDASREGAVSPDFPPPAYVPPSDSCTTPRDADCIRAVYIGSPEDWEIAAIPEAMRLNAGPGGTYFVDAGLEVTVVTAARLPGGWTRFYLDSSPRFVPISMSQLIKPIGTTYTFRVDKYVEAGPAWTYELKQAKPFVRPRPDGKPDIGATVVETDFEVQDCSSGIAVTNPATNTELVADCESLLGLRDTVRGTGKLNWTAGKAMSEWMGVTVSGTPQRVTGLDLANLGLDGELSGLLGNLTGLTTLDLSGNALTGMLPSKLGQLTSLTSVTLDGTSFTGCTPATLGSASTNDVIAPECGSPTKVGGATPDNPQGLLVPGTYRFSPLSSGPHNQPVVFDVPPNAGLEFAGVILAAPSPPGVKATHGRYGLWFKNPEGTLEFIIDVDFMRQWARVFQPGFTSSGTVTGMSKAEYEAVLDLIVESIWRGSE